MNKAEKRLERYFLEYLKNDIPIGEYATSNQCIKDIEQVLNILEQLQQENQKLKEELEDMTLCRDIASGHRQEVQDRETLLLRYQERFINYLEDKIYSIEPKGTSINYNCEYDSEEDYISAIKECSKLNTFKEILKEYKSIIGVK